MRARSFVTLASLFAVVAAQGCGSDFDPSSRVTSLRVLAVSADARWGSANPNDANNIQGETYANQGDTIWLEAEWYALDAKYADSTDARPREWLWLRCVDPDDTSVVGCIKALGEEAQKTGDVKSAFLNVPTPGTDQDVVSVTIPSDAIDRLPTDSQKNATVGVVLLVCPGTINLAQGTDLTSISTGQIPLECDDATTGQSLSLDQWVVGIKRIFLRKPKSGTPVVHENPAIDSITWDGAEWKDGDVKSLTACDDDGNRYDRCTTDQHQIAVKLANDTRSNTDDESTKQVVVEFYSTEGTFEHEVKTSADPTTGFAARKQSKGKDIKMWFVVHDSLGGVVWADRTVHAN